MKKQISIGIFILMISCAANLAFADEELAAHSWSNKLSRGLLNVIASPVEIARGIHDTSVIDGAAQGWTLGLVKGIGMMFVRLGAGVIETVTFPFEFPVDGRAPLLKPEYSWRDWE